MICFMCYENGNLGLLRILSRTDFKKIVLYYEALTPIDRFGLPMTSCFCAKNMLVDPPGHNPAVSSTEAGSKSPYTQEPRNPGSWDKLN